MDKSESWINTEKQYRRISKSFRFYKLASLALCLIFILGGLSVFKDEITLENVRYLIKYLDLGATDITSSEAEIIFDSGGLQNSKAGIYKNDLAVLSGNGLEIFDFANGRIFNDTFIMTNPSLSLSSGYILAYDMGGKTARLYNSFSLLWEKVFDYQLFCADASDTGRFALATSEKNYHCAVYVYDNSFNQTFKWLSADKYISDIALSDDASNRLAVAAVRASGGDFSSEFLVFSTSDGENLASFSFPGELPLKAYASADVCRLLTDRALHFVIPGQTETKTVSFSSEKLSMYGFFDDCSAVVLNENTVGVRQQALIYNNSGETIFEFTTDKQIIDIDEFGGKIYILQQQAVTVIDPESDKTQEYPINGEYTEFCVTGNSAAVFINANGAKLSPLEILNGEEVPLTDQ